jgi:hypothetical protein
MQHHAQCDAGRPADDVGDDLRTAVHEARKVSTWQEFFLLQVQSAASSCI